MSPHPYRTATILLVAVPTFALAALACSDTAAQVEPPDATAAGSSGDETAPAAEGPRPYYTLADLPALDEPAFGDLDAIADRGFVRALVTYSQTNYFLDGAEQRGATYEGLRRFEDFLNQRLGRTTRKVDVVIIPVGRDELIPALADGLGDIAAANLTVTPDRLQKVTFSDPFLKGVQELVVTGPAGPALETLDDISGQEVHVRRSSSYWASLEALNSDLGKRGLEPVRMVAANEFLEDEDLLEMVNAGLIPTVVVDSHKAGLWQKVFESIVVHDRLAVREDGRIAWALRADSPELLGAVNAFVGQHKAGTLLGNIILNRYFKNTKWVRNALATDDRRRFEQVLQLFVTYGERYGFDELMLTALAYQESRLDQSKRSHAGAVGIMQIKPSTAADPNVGVRNIEELEANIHAGTKYLSFVRDRYFSGPEIDRLNRVFFTFAAYNAGPARVRRLRAEAEEMGLDPNRWFNNVEMVAARRIGRETVQYVSNISKYYVAYKLAVAQQQRKAAADRR
jgi:membrane-bound lytic murein transglycosylase MltF